VVLLRKIVRKPLAFRIDSHLDFIPFEEGKGLMLSIIHSSTQTFQALGCSTDRPQSPGKKLKCQNQIVRAFQALHQSSL
jgi:hypothetical protein